MEIGATSVSDDAARFGNATGYDESGAYANLDGDGAYHGDDYRLLWHAEDLALDSRKLAIEGGKPGRFDFGLVYSELPYRLFDTTETVFTSAGSGELVLPNNWLAASDPEDMVGLPAALRTRAIGSDRKRFDAAIGLEAGGDFSFHANYRREERDGIDIIGASNFFQAALLPRVYDFETDLVDVGISYATGPFAVSLVWAGSSFKNNADALTYDNPFLSFAGAERGRIVEEPDNDFQQLSLFGTIALDALRSVVTFTAANGRSEQDENLLAYTINPLLATPELPRQSLDGKVDTANYAFTLVSRPFTRARLKFSYRLDERDNKTPQASWSRVVIDGFVAPDTAVNIPYSYDRTRLSVEGSYRLFDTVRISGAYERGDIERDFQEVAEQTEDSGYGRLNWKPTAALELDFKAGTARRDIERYDATIAESFGQNPLLRKYYLAYRYREFADLRLAFTPLNLPVSVSLDALYADDSYTRSRLGMLAGDELHTAIDFSWAVSEKTSIYLNLGNQTIDAEQAGSALFAAPDWIARHDDDFFTAGFGFLIRGFGDKFDLQFDYTSAAGESEIIVDPPAGLTSEFPELESRFDDLRVALSYDSSERLQWNLYLRYQRFETEDWALEGLAPAAVNSLLSLGAAPYDEDVIAVGLGFRFRMGSSEAP